MTDEDLVQVVDSADVINIPEHAKDLDDVESNDFKQPPDLHIRSGLNVFVIIVSITAALGGLIFGFELTAAGGTFVMSGFAEYFGWSCPSDNSDPSCVAMSDVQQETQKGLISALMTIGAAIGALLNPNAMDRIGRRMNLLLACAIFTIGAAIQAGSNGIVMMYIGRVIGGCGIGMLATCVPVYIAECSPTNHRGTMVTLWQIGVTVGMLIGQGCNIGLQKLEWGWRVSYGGNIVFALILAIAIITYMPESPRYLAAKEKKEELRRVLRKLRNAEDVEHSIDTINAEVEEDRSLPIASWSDVFSTHNNMRRRVFLGIGLQAFNQLSGNEAINFYAPVILKSIFENSILVSFFIGIVNLFAVIVAIFTVDRFGRVPLFIIGGIFMLLAQIANSALQSIKDPTDAVSYTFLITLCIYSFAYHATWGPLSWDVCSEMFPVRERSKAVSLTTASNFAFNTGKVPAKDRYVNP
jgi:SP family sugar:H+ symporter-like MFS transporter